MKWVFLYACVSAWCGHGVVAVEGDGRYYATMARCEAAARRDPYWRQARGREVVCARRDEPR